MLVKTTQQKENEMTEPSKRRTVGDLTKKVCSFFANLPLSVKPKVNGTTEWVCPLYGRSRQDYLSD